jgi:hypothetical protein
MQQVNCEINCETENDRWIMLKSLRDSFQEEPAHPREYRTSSVNTKPPIIEPICIGQ